MAALTDSETVMSVIIDFYRAYLDQDLKYCLSLFSPQNDVAIQGSSINSEKRLGIEQIAQQLLHDWQKKNRVKISFPWYQVSILGDVAWILADRATVREENGEEIVKETRLSAVLVRNNNSWLIAQIHHSVGEK